MQRRVESAMQSSAEGAEQCSAEQCHGLLSEARRVDKERNSAKEGRAHLPKRRTDARRVSPCDQALLGHLVSIALPPRAHRWRRPGGPLHSGRAKADGGRVDRAGAAAGFVRAQDGIGGAIGRVGGVPIRRGGRRWRGSIERRLSLVYRG